jgi:hypothetical protein
VNGGIYQFVAFALQAAQARNLTIDGCAKYNIPSGNLSAQNPFPTETDVIPLNSTTYSPVAIFGADDFDDDNTTIKDVFDIIVKTTRQVIPSCKFLSAGSYAIFVDTPPRSRDGLGCWVCTRQGIS